MSKNRSRSDIDRVFASLSSVEYGLGQAGMRLSRMDSIRDNKVHFASSAMLHSDLDVWSGAIQQEMLARCTDGSQIRYVHRLVWSTVGCEISAVAQIEGVNGNVALSEDRSWAADTPEASLDLISDAAEWLGGIELLPDGPTQLSDDASSNDQSLWWKPLKCSLLFEPDRCKESIRSLAQSESQGDRIIAVMAAVTTSICEMQAVSEVVANSGRPMTLPLIIGMSSPRRFESDLDSFYVEFVAHAPTGESVSWLIELAAESSGYRCCTRSEVIERAGSYPLQGVAEQSTNDPAEALCQLVAAPLSFRDPVADLDNVIAHR